MARHLSLDIAIQRGKKKTYRLRTKNNSRNVAVIGHGRNFRAGLIYKAAADVPWGKLRGRPRANWAGATPKTFWAAESQKSGVAPAHFGPYVHRALLSVISAICLFERQMRAWMVKDLETTGVQKVNHPFFTRQVRHFT